MATDSKKITVNTVFVVSMAAAAGIGIWGLVDPDSMTGTMLGFTNYSLTGISWAWLAICTSFLFLSIFLAFGPYGHIRLGKDDEEPEFSTVSWIAMLFAGGIGVTPMIAMAHRLHAIGAAFEFHYSAASRRSAGFLDDLARAPWRDQVRLHFKDEGARADLPALIPTYEPGMHVYTCGAPRFMDGVFEAAVAKGWPEDTMHREYFTVPEADGWVNRPFVLRLARSGRRIEVPADRSATDVLAEAGVVVDTKCSDGLCGVCATRYDAAASGEVEHRDFVLGRREREHKVILCCSRTVEADAELVISL
jgi:ferredoxin